MSYHYLPANQVERGDILPDVSRHAVTGVAVFPGESARVTFGNGAYIRHFPYGGHEHGYAAVRIERR